MFADGGVRWVTFLELGGKPTNPNAFSIKGVAMVEPPPKVVTHKPPSMPLSNFVSKNTAYKVLGGIALLFVIFLLIGNRKKTGAEAD